jgi:hypothetical protein
MTLSLSETVLSRVIRAAADRASRSCCRSEEIAAAAYGVHES